MKYVMIILTISAQLSFAQAPTEEKLSQLMQGGLGIQAYQLLQKHFNPEEAWHHRYFGEMLLNGIGTQKNLDKGWEHIKIAADLGDPVASVMLLKTTELSSKDIVKLKHQVANNHTDEDTKWEFLTELMTGYFNQPTKHKSAINGLLENCDLNDDRCQIYLAAARVSGINDSITSDEASMLLAKGASQDNTMAIYLLGMEEYKKGTPENFVVAFELFTKGADLGDPSCLGAIGTFYESGLVVEHNLEKALEYFQQAFDKGVGWAGQRIQRLEKIKNSPKVFGEHIYAIDRNRFQSALRGAGIRHLKTSELADIYSAHKIFKDATTLTVAYSPHQPNNLAEMYYFFPNKGNGRERKLRLAKLLAERYGEPKKRQIRFGKVEKQSMQIYEWLIDDDIQIIIQEDPKTEGLIIAYRIKPFINELRQFAAQASEKLTKETMLPF